MDATNWTMEAVAAVREFFLLEKAEEHAHRLSGERGERARALHAAGTSRRECADELVGPPVVASAFVLYRDALRLLAKARQLDSDGVTPEDEATAIEAVRAALQAFEEPRRSRWLAVLELLTTPDDLAFDAMSELDMPRHREDAREFFQWLEATVDPRTPTKLKVMRVLRMVGAVLAVLFLVRAGVRKLFAPSDIALGQPVSASSRFPGTPDPSGLTDGDLRALGVHTTVEDSPWVTIDLGSSRAIGTIRVHNRTDCCFDEGLGLIVEVGEPGDPSPFVAQQSNHYDVWEIDAGGKTGNSVRLRLPRHGYIALSEVEVFAR